MVSTYYNLDQIADAVGKGDHRNIVGGMWDEIGRMQFEYVQREGLAREARFLDVGCGCLRGGLYFIDYLDLGHYYGIDMSQALLDAGYDEELGPRGLQGKLPRENLFCTADFDATGFGVRFDAGLALSVFTHLPLNHIRLCFARLAQAMRPGARFYATFFLVPEDADWTMALKHDPGGIVTYPERDPYHYTRDDVAHALAELPWRLLRLEKWDHPRNQTMGVFERV